MAPPKQSSFLEGSMNDRVSAVPPADFLGVGGAQGGRGGGTTDYERHFAMDWKPPELQFGRNNGYSNVPGNRSSFMSVRSGMSAFTTRTGAPAASFRSPRGLLGKVKEKLHKSRSAWTLRGDNAMAEEDELRDDSDASANNPKSGFLANFPIPPMFKHTRSESMDPDTLRASQRAMSSDEHPASELGASLPPRRPVPPPRADSLGVLPSNFDPTKRPTRDEITANYQSLLASGFFGTRAIQSTRFSPPGANPHRRGEQSPDAPSFAQRLEEEPDESSQLGGDSVPPSPLRLPPPVPSPQREAPPPPPPEIEMDLEEDEQSGSSTPTGIPPSSTAVFNPLPPPRTSSRSADTSMSPPPLPRQRHQTPTDNASLSFSAIPYTATQPGAEPIHTQRPYRPPPVTLARFSVDNSRATRSLDVQHRSLDVQHRSKKRPFSSETANGSHTSFYTDCSSYDYDPMATDGHGGIGVATTTAASPEKVETGARKLIKRLRKSASKLSFRSQSSVSRCDGGDNDGDDGGEPPQPALRTSTSSTVKRSFSWRLGAGSKPDTTSDTSFHSHHPATSVSSFSSGYPNPFGGGETLSLNNASTNNSMDNFNLPPPRPPIAASFHATPTMGQGLPTITASPASSATPADRNRLKKRDIRTRRLRRKEEGPGGSPLAAAAMDWQMPQQPPASPSKRPRRSDASIFMRALDHNNINARTDDEEEEDGSGSDPEMPEPMAAADLPSAAPSEGMEGVEFSFHFPGRTRPASGEDTSSRPLAVVPHVNRGLPSIANTLGSFRAKGSGGVRVVRAD